MSISLEKIYETLHDMKQYYIVDGLEDVIDKLKEPLMIMIMGSFSTGKSTFINALVEKQVVAVDATEATAVITKLSYGLRDKVLIYGRDGSVVENNVEDFDKLTCVANDGNSNELRNLRNKCKYVERQIPLESLKDIIIIDSPGLNGNEEKLTDVTEEFSRSADVVLWMFDADQAVSNFEKSALESLPSRLKPVAIVNKIDLINEDDNLEDFLDDIRIKLDDVVLDVIGVSARYAIKGKTENSDLYYQESHFDDLYKLLEEKIIPQKEYLKLNSFMDGLSDIIDKNYDIKTNTFFCNFINNEFSEYLLSEIEKNNPQAWNLLGKLIEFGVSHYNYDCFYCYKKAAERKHLGALSYMVDFYEKSGSRYDRIYWCSRGVSQGLESAETILAGIYDEDRKYKEAFKLYQKIAVRHNSEAEYKLGYYYLHGLGVDKNVALAYDWLLRAYANKNADAAYWLGSLYEIEEYKNYDESVECYRYAATNCVIKAYIKYAQSLDNRKKYSDAVFWYRKAIDSDISVEEKGNIANRLGMLNSGEFNGVPENKLEEYNNYIFAIQFGNKWAKYNLAKMYMYDDITLYNGISFPDYRKGIILLKECIALNISDAKVDIGVAYLYGRSVKKDVETAFSYFEEAADNNVLAGKYWMAFCYKNGVGVGKDYVRALNLFEYVYSKDNDDLATQSMLAEFYFYGYVGYIDYKKAFDFACAPSKYGYSLCQYIIGFIYENELLGTRDYEIALGYYENAYSKGFNNCINNLMNCYYVLASNAVNAENYFLAKKYLDKSQNIYKNSSENCFKLNDRLTRGIIYAEKFFEYFYAGNLGKCKEFYSLVVSHADNSVKMKFFYKLGFEYFSGNHCNQNIYRGLDYFKESSKCGDVNSKFILSAYACITNGGLASAKLYLEKASSYNEPICMSWYADYILSLNDGNVERTREAYELYLKAYEAGYSGGGLGIAKAIFEEKIIIKSNSDDNYREGCNWLEEVNRNYFNGDVKYLLAVQIRKGYIYNERRAVKLLTEAASTGNLKATKSLEVYNRTGSLSEAIDINEAIVKSAVNSSVKFLKGLFGR